MDPSRRTITFGIATAACKTVDPANHPAARGYLDVRTALQAETTLDETGKPMAIDSRKVECRRPLMAVTEMTDCGRWVCLDHKGKVSVLIREQGKKIEFTPTPGGWDLTRRLETPERDNNMLNKAIQEISAKKRAAAVARDYGAITDTNGSVRIIGCDLFRRPGFSP